MRILVLSDSHGRKNAVLDAIEAHPEARHVFFLGDCVADIEDCPLFYPDRTFHIAHGNCDFSSPYKSSDTLTLDRKTVLFTHGHPYSVKSGMERLYAAARTAGADLVLFGHTHTAVIQYANGVYYVNPGSLCSGRDGPRSYAVVDIEKNGIMPIIIPLR